jgi:hypothetical protein
LLSGTARDLGVNQNNPLDQLRGSAQYLASMPGGDWATKLAHYFQGPGATIGSSGLAYANSVLDKAKKQFGGGDIGSLIGTATNGAACAAGDPMACLSALGGVGGGDGCGTFDFVCKLRKWITESDFFTRLALATLALLFILGGLYLMKERS